MHCRRLVIHIKFCITENNNEFAFNLHTLNKLGPVVKNL